MVNKENYLYPLIDYCKYSFGWSLSQAFNEKPHQKYNRGIEEMANQVLSPMEFLGLCLLYIQFYVDCTFVATYVLTNPQWAKFF